jgi:hypothetical protein
MSLALNESKELASTILPQYAYQNNIKQLDDGLFPKKQHAIKVL